MRCWRCGHKAQSHDMLSQERANNDAELIENRGCLKCWVQVKTKGRLIVCAGYLAEVA